MYHSHKDSPSLNTSLYKVKKSKISFEIILSKSWCGAIVVTLSIIQMKRRRRKRRRRRNGEHRKVKWLGSSHFLYPAFHLPASLPIIFLPLFQNIAKLRKRNASTFAFGQLPLKFTILASSYPFSLAHSYQIASTSIFWK